MVVRTPLVILVTFLLVPLAGCFDGGETPSSSPTDEAVAGLDGNASAPIVSEGREFVFRASDYEYENSLVRFAIVAEEAANVEVAYESRLTPYAAREDCLAFSVMSPDGIYVSNETGARIERPQGFSVVHFRTVWSEVGRARVADQAVGPPEHPFQYKGTAKLHDEHVTWTQPAGRTILVEMGGTSPAFPRDADINDTPNRAEATVRLSADATLTRLPDAAIRCGASFGQTDGPGVYVEGPATLGSAAVLREVELETTTSSTVGLYLHFHGRTEATVHFLGEEIPVDLILVPTMEYTTNLRRNASEAGAIGIEIQESVDTFTSYDGWVLADANWPYLELIPANELES